MRDSKLYRWLSRLDTGEQNEFMRYVSALGGKNREELGRMVKLFVEKVVRGKGLDRAVFYQQMGWPEPYESNLLHQRLTDLKKKLDAFLAIQEFRRDAGAVAVYQMRGIYRRGWLELMRTEVKQARMAAAETENDERRSLYGMMIEESHLLATMELARNFKEPSFQATMDHLEELFCLQTLRYACAALNQDRILNVQHDYGMIDAVIAHLGARLEGIAPVLKLYCHAYHMLAEYGEKQHFRKLKDGLSFHWKSLSGELRRELYRYLINYCVAQINTGEQTFSAEIVQIYEETLQSGALLDEGKMDPGQLKNMIAIAIRSEKLEAAERLLEVYGPMLTPEADSMTIDYNRAILLYHQGEYSKARKLLELVLRDTKDIFFKLDAKLYSWRASYELGDLDMSEDNYNALRMYLLRDRVLSKGIRASYMQFVTHLHSLWQVIHGEADEKKRKRKLMALLKKLKARQSGANILWLVEKVEEELTKASSS